MPKASVCRAPLLPGKVSGSIYCICRMMLHLASCAYHSVPLGVKPLYAVLGPTGFLLLLSSGAAYCAGLLLCCTKRLWTHVTFHALCILGSAIHCTCVCLYIL